VTLSHPERIVPDDTEPGILALHLKRYEFAASRSAPGSMLDAGCGVGYGTAFLAGRAEQVLGVDVSAETIAYARERYALANVSFEVMDVATLELADATFDTICAFEVIEHVPDPLPVLEELARVLRDAGSLFVSTPQALQTTHHPENPFHHVEYSRADFEALLRRFFGGVELYGQRRLQTRRHRLMQWLDVLGLRRRLPALRRASILLGTPSTAELTAEDVVIARDGLDDAAELVAICTRPLRG
jgi:SAM-dependent methyltransferase